MDVSAVCNTRVYQVLYVSAEPEFPIPRDLSMLERFVAAGDPRRVEGEEVGDVPSDPTSVTRTGDFESIYLREGKQR
ncbi:MAG: hypothetical protein ACI9YT_001888 [Halobacteriales archaeon]|jgi:hypothetical protein